MFVSPQLELISSSSSPSTQISMGMGHDITDELSPMISPGIASDGKLSSFIPSADMFPRFPRTFLMPDRILDDELISTTDGPSRRFLIRWQVRPPSDDSWVLEPELQRLDAALLHRYLSAHASVMREFERGRIDGAAPLPLEATDADQPLDDTDDVPDVLHRDLRRRDDPEAANGRQRYNLRPRRR